MNSYPGQYKYTDIQAGCLFSQQCSLWKILKISKHRLFSALEWSHTLSWVAGWADCNSRKRQEKAPIPSLSFSCSSSHHFQCQKWNTAGLCSSQAYIDYSRSKGGIKSKTSIVDMMEPTGASLCSRDEQEPGRITEVEMVSLIGCVR